MATREPRVVTDNDRAPARLERCQREAYVAALRLGYAMGREDERKGVPRGTRPFDGKR